MRNNSFKKTTRENIALLIIMFILIFVLVFVLSLFASKEKIIVIENDVIYNGYIEGIMLNYNKKKILQIDVNVKSKNPNIQIILDEHRQEIIDSTITKFDNNEIISLGNKQEKENFKQLFIKGLNEVLNENNDGKDLIIDLFFLKFLSN